MTRGRIRLAGLAAILGGLAWIPVRLAIGGTWGTTVMGLDYVEWNRLMVVPLARLFIGLGGVAIGVSGMRGGSASLAR